MSFILDTHAFLWFISDNPRLSKKAKKTIENQRNKIFKFRDCLGNKH